LQQFAIDKLQPSRECSAAGINRSLSKVGEGMRTRVLALLAATTAAIVAPTAASAATIVGTLAGAVFNVGSSTSVIGAGTTFTNSGTVTTSNGTGDLSPVPFFSLFTLSNVTATSGSA